MRIKCLPGLLAVSLLLPFLAGCGMLGILGDNPLTAAERSLLSPQAVVYEVQDELNQGLRSFNVYADQPFCNAELLVGCADRDIVLKGDTISQDVTLTIMAAQIAVLSGADEAGALAAAARVAVVKFSAFIITESLSP